MRRVAGVGRDRLVGLGEQIGRFTHSGRFRLGVGALGLLARHALHKAWVKPGAEMSFLYGNHVLKSGLGRMTDGTPALAGVVVLSMADVPLGFGVAARGTAEARRMDPSAPAVLRQADVGEYLRAEDEIGG